MDLDAGTPLPRSRALRALLGLTALVTALPVVGAVLSVLRATGVLGVGDPDGTVLIDGFGAVERESDVRALEAWTLLASVPAALACLALLVGLVRYRPWAREGVVGLFGLVGSVLLVFSTAVLLQDGPGLRSLRGVAGSLLVVGVAVLATRREVRDDLDRHRLRRELREREAARP